MNLSKEQIKRAQYLQRAGDYEVGQLLAAYLHGQLDDDGVSRLLEEVSA